MDLATFLASIAVRRLEWGRCDCCLVVADWIAERIGADPAGDLRGAYADEQGAARAIEAEGGLVALFQERLSRIGLKRTDSPRPGDVAVVAIGPSRALFGSIAGASGWAIKSRRGLVVSRAVHPVACWTFADG